MSMREEWEPSSLAEKRSEVQRRELAERIARLRAALMEARKNPPDPPEPYTVNALEPPAVSLLKGTQNQ